MSLRKRIQKKLKDSSFLTHYIEFHDSFLITLTRTGVSSSGSILQGYVSMVIKELTDSINLTKYVYFSCLNDVWKHTGLFLIPSSG